MYEIPVQLPVVLAKPLLAIFEETGAAITRRDVLRDESRGFDQAAEPPVGDGFSGTATWLEEIEFRSLFVDFHVGDPFILIHAASRRGLRLRECPFATFLLLRPAWPMLAGIFPVNFSGSAISGNVWRIYRSIPRRFSRSLASHSDIATPEAPARAVRPIR